MTPTEKQRLIKEIAAEFWPAKRSGSLASIMDAGETGILNVDLFGYDKVDGEIDRDLMRKIRSVLQKDVEIGVLVLDYSYALDELDLYMEVEPKVELTYGVMTLVVNIILDFIDEQAIRDRFTAYESEFFAHTESTPADWRMSE